MNTEYLKGFLLTALGVIVLSFDALMIRLIEVDSFSLLFWRGLLLSLMVTLWCRFRMPGEVLFSRDPAFLRSAFLFFSSSTCFVCAINLTSVANVLVIISATPLFSALLARLVLKEKTPPVTLVAIVISILGIAWVLKDSWQSPDLNGDLLALLCGLSLAAKFVNDRAVSHRNMSPALISAGLLTAVVSYALGQPMTLSGNDWGWMLLLCMIILPVSFILITTGPMRIPAAEVGMLMLLETAMGPLWIWIWLAEIPNRSALEGGAVVVGTLLIHGLIQWRKNHNKRVRKTPVTGS